MSFIAPGRPWESCALSSAASARADYWELSDRTHTMWFVNTTQRELAWAILLLSVATAQAAGRQLLQGHVPEAVAESKVLGRVPAANRMSLAVGLPLRNREELDKLLKQLADPSSPAFRHYLTPAQFAERFS